MASSGKGTKHPRSDDAVSEEAQSAVKRRQVVSDSDELVQADDEKFVGMINPHLRELQVDHMYHLGLDTSMNLKEMFGDVKFVCLGGSADRMHSFVMQAAKELNLLHLIPVGCKLAPVGKAERYHLYKLGPLIAVNHGMGMPSISILLHELTKLLRYAHATDFVYIRVGTSGGLGVTPGTVIITDTAVNSALEPLHRATILGQLVERPTSLDRQLGKALFDSRGDVEAMIGKTMATDDFYEEQARMDGFFCEFSAADQKSFLLKCHEAGVLNIEMESVAFASFCHRSGVKGAVVCTALVNRLLGDQIESSPQQLAAFSNNAITLVLRYIKATLSS